MMLFGLLAAVVTFTATSTGVSKNTPIEFLFAGKGTDRDYETLFELDDSIDDFCNALEKAGIPRGKAVDSKRGIIWPVGCPLKLEPSLDEFLVTKLPKDIPLREIIYTGGIRQKDGRPEAAVTMPRSVFSLFSLNQSPLQFNGLYEQGIVYNCFLAKRDLKAGEKVKFTLSWDDKTKPLSIKRTLTRETIRDILEELRKISQTTELDVEIDFSPEMTVGEAETAAHALSVIDSVRIKMNGYPQGHLFYKAFLPLVKWTDRKERLVQPFELTIGETNRLVRIEEDWKVEGLDPKLTPHEIAIKDAVKYPSVETCFIYTTKETPLSAVYKAMKDLSDDHIVNWYVFSEKSQSLHNPPYDNIGGSK